MEHRVPMYPQLSINVGVRCVCPSPVQSLEYFSRRWLMLLLSNPRLFTILHPQAFFYRDDTGAWSVELVECDAFLSSRLQSLGITVVRVHNWLGTTNVEEFFDLPDQ